MRPAPFYPTTIVHKHKHTLRYKLPRLMAIYNTINLSNKTKKYNVSYTRYTCSLLFIIQPVQNAHYHIPLPTVNALTQKNAHLTRTPILSSQVVSLPFQSVIHPEDSSL